MGKPEIKHITEKEIRIGRNRDTIIEGNIIFVEAEGVQTLEIAELQKKAVLELALLIDGQVNYLIDLNRCGKNFPEARAIWKELSEHERTAKVATFGVHPVAKVVASFVMNVKKRKNMRFFKAKDEAIKWLLE